jgi:hypothetical protein
LTTNKQNLFGHGKARDYDTTLTENGTRGGREKNKQTNKPPPNNHQHNTSRTEQINKKCELLRNSSSRSRPLFSSKQHNNSIMIDRHQLKNFFVSFSYLETKLIVSPPPAPRTISSLCFLRCFLARRHAFRKSLTAEHQGDDDDGREGGREGDDDTWGVNRNHTIPPKPHFKSRKPQFKTPKVQYIAKDLQKLKIMPLGT